MTEIAITRDITIHQIQEAFQSHFPYLKIEFYKASHEPGQGNANQEKLDAALSIGEVQTKSLDGQISIHGNQKVSTLEQAFSDTFGLNVQVFRKSGNIFLQTTATDHWTLAEQNETAQEFNETSS